MGSVIAKIMEVFTAITTWFVESMTAVTSLFYAEGALTFIGVLAISSLGIAVTLLLIRLVTNFIQFKG